MEHPIQVAIYEDNPQLREGLSMLIDGSEGFAVVGSFKSCERVVRDIQECRPDVILMDIDMPGMTGIEGLLELRKHHRDVKVLMLTVFDDDKNVFDAIVHGANGYLLKKTSPARLLEYIADAAGGGAPMTSSIATQVLRMFSQRAMPVSADYKLSEREMEVLHFLVDGYSYKMIAATMFISIDTVRSHIKKIYEKLHVHSKSEAVAKALRDGMA
jgi:DNA-binding NarL/FixJ family response regulator